MSWNREYKTKHEIMEEAERDMWRFEFDADYDARFYFQCPQCGFRNRVPAYIIAAKLGEWPQHLKFPPRPVHELLKRLPCVKCQSRELWSPEIMPRLHDGERQIYDWPNESPVFGDSNEYLPASLFHRVSCVELAVASTEDIVGFLNAAEARSAGYAPCKKCGPY